MPPEPRITEPASGFAINSRCTAAYSSSVRLSWTSRVKSFVSTKVNIAKVYGFAVGRQGSRLREEIAVDEGSNDQAQPRAGLARGVASAGLVTGRGVGCSAELGCEYVAPDIHCRA